MADIAIRPGVSRGVVALIVVSASFGVSAWPAHADPVVYLNSINARPGYNFTSSDAALAYGHGVCDKVAGGRSYAQLVGDVEADVNTTDEYQANYLIGQAVNELCPELIWQLRNSAAGYGPVAR
ncbi:MAG: DUF732 domain-containing protein [Mycobacterium sp.]|nr:DUF732 domain-containing protein [Mycobacterium sp.]